MRSTERNHDKELQRQIRQAKAQLIDMEWEIDELRHQLRQIEEQLAEDGADEQLHSEAQQLRQRIAEQEEQALHQMLALDALRAQETHNHD